MSVAVDGVAEGRVLYSRTVRLAGGRAELLIPTGADFAGAVSFNATSITPAGDPDQDEA